MSTETSIENKMCNKTNVLNINIAIILFIAFYFVINISFNFSFKHKYFINSTFEEKNQVIYSTTEVVTEEKTIHENRLNMTFDKLKVFQMRVNRSDGNINNTSFLTNMSELNEILMRVKTSDERLNRLTKFQRIRSDSRLIYAKDMFEMTRISINHNHCSQLFGKDLLLLVLVFNRVDGFERRQTIRETWGQEIKTNPKSKLYFAIGLTNDTTVEEKVKEENEKFGDILQFSYYESYYNCTIKAVGLLRWTAMKCPFVKFMLKVDDDSVILTQNLLTFIESIEASSIYGYLWQGAFVSRGSGKWSVSSKEYPKNHYPNYIGGPYLIPGCHVLPLYETVVNKCLPALPFEDVYITGIVANEINIERKKLSSLLYLREGCRALELDFCYYKSYSIFWQGLDDNQMRQLWQMFREDYVCPSIGQHC